MNEKNTQLTINITGGTILKAVLILLFFYFLFQLRDLVLVLITSIVLAASIEPATKWFQKYKIPRIPSVLLVYLSVFLVLGGFVSLFVPPLLSETNNFLSVLPQYMDSLTAWNPLQTAAHGAEAISKSFSLKDAALEVRAAINNFQGGLLSILSGVFGGVFSLILIIVLSFYLAVQEDGIDEFLRLISPIKHREYVTDLWHRSQLKIGRWMQGQLLLSVIIAVLTYLGLTILGVPYALLLALLAGLFELIPIFGPVISAIPAVVLAFINGTSFIDPGTGSALAVALFYILVQQFENHLIYPLVVRKVVGVHPILVIIALIIGWNLVGFLGVILAVPIAAAIMEFAHDVQRKKVA